MSSMCICFTAQWKTDTSETVWYSGDRLYSGNTRRSRRVVVGVVEVTEIVVILEVVVLVVVKVVVAVIVVVLAVAYC